MVDSQGTSDASGIFHETICSGPSLRAAMLGRREYLHPGSAALRDVVRNAGYDGSRYSCRGRISTTGACDCQRQKESLALRREGGPGVAADFDMGKPAQFSSARRYP
jgi:hypothetical protein